MIKSKALKDDELGGLLLILGSFILLITIYFEYRIGWIGVERPDEELPGFLFDSWHILKWIWTWQMLGHVIFVTAYFLLLKNATTIMRILWSLLVLSSILMLVAFGITLGSYYPALEVYQTQPVIFDTLRGGIGFLYRFGRSGLLVFVVAFLIETLSKKGKIKRINGLSVLACIILLFVVGYLLGISVKVTGVSFFLLPLTLGYFYRRDNA